MSIIDNNDPNSPNVAQDHPSLGGEPHSASKNALSHGVYAKEIVLSGESSEDFESLHASLCQEFNPEGELENDTVTEIAQVVWVKRRLVRSYRASCEAAAVASPLMNAEKTGSSGHEQLVQGQHHGASSGKFLFRGKAKQLDALAGLTNKLAVADGVDVATVDRSSLADVSPSVREFMQLVSQLARPANPDETTFEHFGRPSDLERFLKILGTLDTRIEKAMTRLAGFKEYQRQYAKNVVQGNS
jgi:hypothetical protein